MNINRLHTIFFIVDIGFILYWLVTLFSLIPNEYLFNDYTNPILVNWNWSFFPLDIAISATGLTSIYLNRKNNIMWKNLTLISLVLTFCSGLQAIAFWTFHQDFDLVWWIPNLFLLIYPLFYIPSFIKITK